MSSPLLLNFQKRMTHYANRASQALINNADQQWKLQERRVELGCDGDIGIYTADYFMLKGDMKSADVWTSVGWMVSARRIVLMIQL